MRHVYSPIALALVLAAAAPAGAQILDTLSGFDDEARWQGQVRFSMSLSGGNTEEEDYLVSAAGQWEGGRNRVRLIGGYDLSRNDGQRTSDELTGHLRHNYRLTGRLFSLAFVQHQRNPFQRLSARDLLGAGVRFDFVNREERRAAVGVSAMYEFEELRGAGRSETARWSAFLDLRGRLREHVRLAVVGWYQPVLDDFGDTRASAAADLDVDLAGPLTLAVSLSWEYDARPPEGIEEADWTLRTGLRVLL